MLPRPEQAVILAGGLGTRLRPLTDTVPKPMIPFHGRPFSEYLVELLREQGFTRILFLLGYLPDQVVEHFGDGSRFGVHIEYSTSPVEDDTGTRLKHALAAGKLDPSFFLLYCDNYLPIDFERLWRFFEGTKADALITLYDNADGYTKNNTKVGPDGLVEIYDKSRTAEGLQGVELGFALFSRDVVAALPEGNVSFEKETYPRLVAVRKLAGYVVRHRYYSVGSHARLPLTEAFLARTPAIFLDRDGVLNRKAPPAEYITAPEKFEWLPGALDSLRRLKEAGYRIYVISNQAGIARGKMTQADLDAIHAKMKGEAEAAGGAIDAVYVCPHHWDENCDCRKPKPGMLFQAQKDHHLDLSRMWFVGDDERDIEAGEAAGCHTALVTPEKGLSDWVTHILSPHEHSLH